MADRILVPSADFVRNIGFWQEQAARAPISITYHGRERLVLLAAERYNGGGAEVAAAAPAAITTLAVILDNIDEGYIALSDDLDVVSMNRVAEAFFGVRRESVAGFDIARLFPSLGGAILLDKLRIVARSRKLETFEAAPTLFEGRRLAFHAFPLAQGIGVLFANLTETEHLRTRVAAAEASSAAVAAHPHIGVIYCDTRGRISSVSARVSEWLAFEPAALTNVRVVDVLAVQSRRQVAEAIENALSSAPSGAIDAHFIGRDHRECVLSLTAAPLTIEGAAPGVCLVLTAQAVVEAEPRRRMAR